MFNNLGIFWFRQDLRLQDNMALNNLIKDCTQIIPIYILDQKYDLGEASKWWLHNSLNSLNESLKRKKSELHFYKGKPEEVLDKLVDKYNVERIYWNRMYDNYSIKRDTKIKKELEQKNVNVISFKGSLINEPWNIKNKSGSFFKVFTPYWNNCIELNNKITLCKEPKEIKTLSLELDKRLYLDNLKLFSKKSKWMHKFTPHWIPGENEALKKLNYFKKNIIDNYDEGRDRPDKNYTSKLSPHIHFGEISPERIYFEIKKNQNSNILSKKKYLAEIGWREFSYNLLYNYPKIKKEPIQEKFKKFPWVQNTKHLKNWQEGNTGYPIVDAGMRQLYQTGWMHNRVRMIVGSFLCKNLLTHWHHGESWFFDTLLDADLGSNSAGWQWIAGCGADAAPYFRVFNPVTQGLKFDFNAEYVKKYIPELKDIPISKVHSPWELNINEQKEYNCILGKDYPKPIVNLSSSRDRALTAFSKLKNL